jgi:hypothetical protein
MESQAPYNYLRPVVLDVDLEQLCDAIYVGVGGDVVVVGQNGIPVTLKTAVAGSFLVVQAKRVNASGTTATNLVACFYV